jgi:hypothetical protein
MLDDPEAAEQLRAVPRLALYPGPNYHDDQYRSDIFYDQLHHAAVAVGVNTSAVIEAAIVGCPVHVLISEAHRDIQEGAPHFRDLREAGGLAEVTDSIDQHLAGLERALAEADPGAARHRPDRFLEAFVRPHGLDTPATPILADALEELARSPAPHAPRSEGVQRALGELDRVTRLPRRAHD